MTTDVYQRGETVPCWAENKDWAGAYTDPSEGIKITLRDPDGAIAKDVDESDIDDTAMGQETVPRTGIYVFYYNSGAVTTLASDITAIATTISVAAGEGDKLPASDFFIEIDSEILKCSSRTADVLTVTRHQKGTTAAAHDSGTSIWRTRGWWHWFSKAIDGSGATERTVITHGSFKLE